MAAIGRRELMLGVGALALVGCDGANGVAGASAADMAIGAENAPATLIEYASSTCPHCAEFHERVWDQLKTNYIDTGKLRFIFREFPTPPVQVAVAGFQIARCGGATPEQYLARVGVLFDQQQAIFASGTMEGVRLKLVEIGQGAGLSEQQVMECISDQAGAERIRNTVEEGTRQFDITGTPTLILNGQKLTDPSAMTYEGLSRMIDQAIAG
ncbi:MAG: DsbA family protein [Hyphomonadaceae bacterium]|nr:DsbA family protein [Hyphomonadaceae bacterium]